MSAARCGAVLRLDLAHFLRRPLTWIWLTILVFFAWQLSTGDVRIQSGDSTVGGTKAWITSQFAVAQVLTVFVPLVYAFFIAVAAGMSVIRDGETGVSELLRSTPLRAGEYVWGKFLAALLAFVGVLAIHVGVSALCNHGLADAESAEYVGPFVLASYVVPALVFALPFIVLLAGASFAIGERTRNPILVFLLPVALFLACLFFLWEWSPSWLDPRINRLLMLLDPTGVRWLQETYLNVDRGVAYYNTQPIRFDWPFLASRPAFALVGLLAVRASARGFDRRSAAAGRAARRRRRPAPAASDPSQPPAALRPSSLRRPGFVRGFVTVARAELRELRSQPGLYLFVPLIVLFAWANTTFDMRGGFDTPLLVTPGLFATRSMGWLSSLLCLLTMFYGVESLRREESTRLASIVDAAPVRTSALLLGKLVANGVVVASVLAATLLAYRAVLLFQGAPAFAARPLLLVWGALLLPTLFFWSALVSAVWALTRSAWSTWGIGLGILVLTAYELETDGLEWAWNWPLWGRLPWSDTGAAFELHGKALLLNRVMVTGWALFLFAVAVRAFPRHERDASRVLASLRPRRLLVGSAPFLPLAAVGIVAGAALTIGVDEGYEGGEAEKLAKDTWRRNVATWLDAPVPDIAAVDVALELAPERRGYAVEGTFELENPHEAPLKAIPLTIGPHWRALRWTLDGEDAEPEERVLLRVFRLERALARGDSVSVGFAHEGVLPDGMSRGLGGLPEFILPSGVVLTSFRPSFVPVVGFQEELGVDEENAHDAREYPEDFFEGDTPSLFGAGRPFPVRLAVTAPEAYTVNGVGTLKSATVADGRRTSVWETERPVTFFNVVAGRWDVRAGDGTAIYYFPGHEYNLDEMQRALDGARRHYSDWFAPFPWETLKLSEFPALATYAQGFATNITFSEALGFLSKPGEGEVSAATMVTAHEAAHQWWGNLLTPGEGPGANVLSEGLAHYSTILLLDELDGLERRIAFCELIEDRYGDARQADSERALVQVDGSRPGDTTVTYDKGGWVFWMLQQELGRERMLAGLQGFLAEWSSGRDHAVLQDLIAHLRTQAPDPERYDRFAEQWFFGVVAPELVLADARRVRRPDGSYAVHARVLNRGTGSVAVEVAATRGERFPAPRGTAAPVAEARGVLAALTVPSEAGGAGYRDARTQVSLAPGGETRVEITCDFEPELLVVDPDALVLQLNRKLARHTF